MAITILSERTVDGFDELSIGINDKPIFQAEIDVDLREKVLIGETYTLVIDGVEYICTAVDVDGEGEGTVAGLFDGYTDEAPYLITVRETCWVALQTDGPHTFAIYKEEAPYNGSIDLISGLRPKNGGAFPLVHARDVQMPDGTRLSELEFPEAEAASAEVPEFDLTALGLPAIPSDGSGVMVETDTGEICEALDKGPVKFIVADETSTLSCVMNAIYVDGSYVCGFDANGTKLTVMVMEGMIGAMINQAAGTGAALPSVTTEDNGKILQVADGVWTAVAIADSAVADYIDSYINDALGGDY